jgi:hypothetical protein
LLAEPVDQVNANRGGLAYNEVAFLQVRKVRKVPALCLTPFIPVPVSQSIQLVSVVDFQVFTKETWDLGLSPELVVTNCDDWLKYDFESLVKIKLKIFL